ncbi:MAG TPA: DMT family transporter [Pyrinomonadaceae bacterium]|jgi:drug/metabolite transporter (DMT)-like permease
MRIKSNWAADGALVVVTLIWGSTFVMAKDVLDYWPPLVYITIRFALASVVLVALFPRLFIRARGEEWRAGATLGLLMAFAFAGQAVGQVYTTPSKSAFITGLTTPLVPFVALVILRVRPTLENLIGVSLASIGGMLILIPHDASVNRGDVLTLLCTTLFAAHITLLSSYARRFDIRQLTVLQITSAAIVFVLVWLSFKACALLLVGHPLPEVIARESVPLDLGLRVLWQIVYLALVATVATFLLWTWGQSRMSATHAAIIFSLEPVFATIFALAVRGGGEWMGGRGALGAALIFLGIIISELHLGERRKSAGQGVEALDEDRDISLAESNG